MFGYISYGTSMELPPPPPPPVIVQVTNGIFMLPCLFFLAVATGALLPW